MEIFGMKFKSDTKRFFIGLIAVWAVYVIATFLAPETVSVSRYGLTLFEANLLRLTIILPLFFIWITVLLSFIWFRRYTEMVRGSEEELGYRKITKGLWMLLLVVMLPSFFNVAISYFPDNGEIVRTLTILRNYVTIALYLVGFVYLWQSSVHLLKTVGGIEWGKKYRTYVLLTIGALTFIYAYAIFNNPFRTETTDPLVRATYYLPDVLIILTVVVPYLLIWLFGSMAVLNFMSYARHVPGVIYRESFKAVSTGLTVTIALLIGLQFLSQANAALSRSALGVVMVIIYALLIAIAAGYLMIARGARKLALLEEVE